MKIKNVITVLLVAILLASCAPAITPTLSTKLSAPSVTPAIPVPSTTPLPTQSLATPTETKPSNADFLAHSENVFPLAKNIRGFFKFIGTMQLGNPIYEKFTAPDGITKIYVSFLITSGNVEFLVPAWWFHRSMDYFSLTLVPSGNPDDDAEYIPSDIFIKSMTEGVLVGQMPEGQSSAKVTLILDSGLDPEALTPMFGYINPFPRLWEKTDWDESVRKFVQTGDPNDLPKINGLPVLPAVSIRNTGSVPFWDE